MDANERRGYLLAGITILIWAGFIVMSRIGGRSALGSLDLTALRLAAAALALSPWWLPRLFKPRLRQLRATHAAMFALVAGLGYPLLAYEAFEHAPASHGAILISGLLPFFTTLFAFLLLGERPGRLRLLGLALIAVGVGVLFVGELAPGAAAGNTLTGDLLFAAASASWGLFSALLRRWRVRAFDVTLAAVSVAAIAYLPVYALWLPHRLDLVPPAEVLLQAAFQGLLVVCCAMWTYAKATEYLGPSRLAVTMSSVPAVGVLLAVLLLGETLLPAVLAGVVLTSAGALVGALGRSTSARPG